VRELLSEREGCGREGGMRDEGSILLLVTKTSLGLWFSAHNECGALLLRSAGFPASFGAHTYARAVTQMRQYGYRIETREA
jgi:hypothetical protein